MGKLTRAAVEAVGAAAERGPAASKMTSLVAATLGTTRDVAAGLLHSGGLGVGLPCASAKRSRLLLEMFDDCSLVCRKLSLRQWAIIREMNESVFALNFSDTGGTGHF